MKGLMEGRVAVITGAGRDTGIGYATARLFIEHGGRAVLCDLPSESPKNTAATLGDSAIGAECDVTDAGSCAAAVQAAMSAWGRVDCVVNNAGLTQRRKVAEVTPEDYDLVTDVVLRGTLLMTQAALPHLSRDGAGSIVNVSSLSALQGGGIFGGPHYCAAKAGVLGLTRAMAKEFGPDGIRANAIAAGMTATRQTQVVVESSEMSAPILDRTPMKRFARPEEIAGAALFLSSQQASYVNGQTLNVCGGFSISG